MGSPQKNHINKIYSWALVKGSGEESIDGSIFLSGIILLANGQNSDGEETSIIEARIIPEEEDSEIIIHREEELSSSSDEWSKNIVVGIINKLYEYDLFKYNFYIPPGLAMDLLRVVLHQDPAYLNTSFELPPDNYYIYEEADSSYFCEIEDGDDETIMLGGFARFIQINDKEGPDINNKEKIDYLSKKLCNNVVALGSCKKDIDGFDSETFEWTGVHLIPMPYQ